MEQNNNTETKHLLSEFQPVSYEAWVAEAEASLKGKPFDKLFSKTYENIGIKPIYRRQDVENIPHLKSQYPDFYPYVRGTEPAGFKKQAWEVAQEINYILPEEFNTALKYDLGRGQDSISLVVNSINTVTCKCKCEDLCAGVVLSTVHDFEVAFDGIDFNKLPIHFRPKVSPLAVFSLFIAYLKKTGFDLKNLKGSLGFDPCEFLLRKGTLKNNKEGLAEKLVELVSWTSKNTPNFRPLEISAAVYSEAGANAVQELGYSISTAVNFIHALLEKGLDIDTIAHAIAFKFTINNNFFMEIAKFRAAKMIWAKIMREFGANEESQKIIINARTAKRNKSTLDAFVNMLRVSSESLAGIFGGVSSLHVGSYDEAVGIPDDFSRRIARNTQIILKEECNTTEVIDPAGGSWYVESLTAELTKKAWELFAEIEKDGGMLNVLVAAKPQQAVKALANQRLKNLSSRKDILVGVNKYPNKAEKPFNVKEYNKTEVIDKLNKSIKACEASRDNAKVQAALKGLASYNNLISNMIDAANAGATLTELIDAIHTGSEQITAETLPMVRLAENFESLRAFAESYKAKKGFYPKVFSANMGPLKQHKPRADFAQDFFQVGGFEIISTPGFNSADEAADEAIKSDAEIIVICSTDDTYPEIVPTLAKKVKAAKPHKKIILAGYPTEYIDQFKAAGVDDFIHVKADIYKILSDLQKLF